MLIFLINEGTMDNFPQAPRIEEAPKYLLILFQHFINLVSMGKSHVEELNNIGDLKEKTIDHRLFSSPKGNFFVLNCLHRYDKDTTSDILNLYLLEFRAKLEERNSHLEEISIGASVSPQEKISAIKKQKAELDVGRATCTYARCSLSSGNPENRD